MHPRGVKFISLKKCTDTKLLNMCQIYLWGEVTVPGLLQVAAMGW